MIQVAAIFVAEKLVGGVFSKLGGEAILGPIKGAIGIDSDTEKIMHELKVMSGMLSGISSRVDAVPSKVTFVDKWQSCENKINSIVNLLDKAEESKQLAKSQWQELIHFIKEGTESNDYYSLADSLFNAAYGISFNACFKWKEDLKKLPAGKQEYCYAFAFNNTLLDRPIGIKDYIDKHVHFAASLYAMIKALCLTAEKTFTVLKKQSAKIPAGETAELVKEAIDNPEVNKNLFDLKEKFIEKAKPFIINAFRSDHLCGFAFDMYVQIDKKKNSISIYNAQKFKNKEKKLYPIKRLPGYEMRFEDADPKGWEISFNGKATESKVQFLSLNHTDKKYLRMSTQIGDMGGRLDYLDIGNAPYTWELLVWRKSSYGVVFLLRDQHGHSMRINNPGAFMAFLGAKPRAQYSSININDDDFYWYLEPKTSA